MDDNPEKIAVSTLTRLKLSKALALQQQGQIQEAKIICEDVLKEHPDNADSLHLLGIIALQGGDYLQAAKLIGKAVDIHPHNPTFFYHLGVALQELEELDGAMTSYDLATAMKPDFTEAWYNWGNALQKCERFDEAVACYDKALVGKKDFAEAHYNRAVALKGLKKYEEALLAYDQAIALKQDYAEAYFGRGNALAELERPLDSIADYDHALSLCPYYAEACFGRGTVLYKLKKFDEALVSYDQAIALKSGYTDAYLGRGAALHELKKFDEALAGYDQVLALKPDCVEAYLGRGAALHELKRFDKALTGYDQVLALKPDCAEAYLGRGNVLHELERDDEALVSYDQAIALKPDYAEAYNNRGAVFNSLKQRDKALLNYDRATALKPDLASAHWNKSLILLLIGQFAKGWELYEWRWQRKDFSSPKRNFPQSPWLGQDSLTGKPILLHSEQGLGDTIQFCRYIPLVARLGAKVILEVEEVLVPLLKDLEGVEEIITKGKTLPGFDYHCPLMSLPLAFKTELHTIPSAPQYLQASLEKLTSWQEKLGEKTKPRVGLVWSGGKIHKNDHNRSITLAEWIPYLPAGYQYISLQKDIRKVDEETLKRHNDILRFDQELRDFSDTAALCSLMDVVISVDTSVAHLSGALGKPTWILLPFILQDWRWLLDRKDSPWYPSVTLYRQPQQGDWVSVFEEVRNDLLTIGDRKVTD